MIFEHLLYAGFAQELQSNPFLPRRQNYPFACKVHPPLLLVRRSLSETPESGAAVSRTKRS